MTNDTQSIGQLAALILNRLRNEARINEHRRDEQADTEERTEAGRGDAKKTSHDKLALVG